MVSTNRLFDIGIQYFNGTPVPNNQYDVRLQITKIDKAFKVYCWESYFKEYSCHVEKENLLFSTSSGNNLGGVAKFISRFLIYIITVLKHTE